jgi:rhomboid family protein
LIVGVLVFVDLLRKFAQMLTDRSYLRTDYPQRKTSAVVWLIATSVAAFVLELVLVSPWFGATGAGIVEQLSLTVQSLQNGHLWTLLTHSLLHSTSNPFHLLCVLLGLIFIGRELEPLLGSRRFAGVYLGALIVGALGWAAAHWVQGGVHIGASAGVLGLLVVLVCLYPNQELNFLVLFLFPVTLRPKYLAWGILALNLLALIFFELPGTAAPFDFAPSAHLGGMLTGWIYFRYLHANNGWDRAPTLELPGWLRRNEVSKPEIAPVPEKPVKASPNLRAEVDFILDKINSEGFGALTEEEKRTLDEAKDLLSRP